REANSTAFKLAVNHLFQASSALSNQSTNRIKPPPCQPGAFYSNPPPPQPLFSSNSLFNKEFSDPDAPEEVRIIGPQISSSTTFCHSPTNSPMQPIRLACPPFTARSSHPHDSNCLSRWRHIRRSG